LDPLRRRETYRETHRDPIEKLPKEKLPKEKPTTIIGEH